MPKVWIGGEEVYLDPDKHPEFSYSITDLTDPTKVRGARSTSFDVPATNGARAALGGVTISESSPTSAPFRVGDGGHTIFSGTCTPVEWSDDAIAVNAYGDNAGWAAEAKSTKLQEVDLGITGTIDAAYQIASWADQDQADIYPLIDYGSFADRLSSYNVTVPKLRPGIRIHRLLTKFFNDIGYTVKPEGRLQNHWKKLYMPNTGRIQLSDQYLAGNSASVTGDGAVAFVTWFNEPIFLFGTPPPYNAPGDFPPSYTATDPGGNLSGQIYVAPLNQKMRVTLNGALNHTEAGSILSGFSDETFRIVVYINDGNHTPLSVFEYTVGSIPSYTLNFDDQVLWEGNVNAGTGIGVGIYCSTFTKTVTATNLTVKHEVANVEYQSGVTLDIASLAPKMTVADLISGLCNMLRLVVRTDDGSHVVTFKYYNDFVRGTSEGIDWTERIDHSSLSKVQPPIPKSWVFRFKEDDKDQYLRDFLEEEGRGYGDYDLPTGGMDKPVEVNVPFAATVQRMTLGGCVLPSLRKEGPYYQQDFYEWTPRILVFEGMSKGAWTFAGTAYDDYPRSYFVGATPRDISLAYGPERATGSVQDGSVGKEWRDFIRRTYSPYVRALCRVYDDEFMGFPFGRPRLIHDGWHRQWCLVQEIRGKRFGDETFVECDLVPM